MVENIDNSNNINSVNDTNDAENKSTNVVWHGYGVNQADRNNILGHKSILLWFTGLSGSGKSTVATELQKRLIKEGKLSYVLDGDNVRHGLNKNLSFSPEDRTENIRRIGEVSKLFVDAGIIVITGFISPYREDRDSVRQLMGKDHAFAEIFIKCPLEVCEQRDPKGLYKKARAGIIKNYTGISAPYEEPVSPEAVVETDKYSVQECVDQLYNYLKEKQII